MIHSLRAALLIMGVSRKKGRFLQKLLNLYKSELNGVCFHFDKENLKSMSK